MAGFAVFSILGNMAYRQTVLAENDPALRVTICEDQLSSEVLCPTDFTGCDMCESDLWRLGGRCCGAFTTNTVARGGVYLAFAVCSALRPLYVAVHQASALPDRRREMALERTRLCPLQPCHSYACPEGETRAWGKL